jgi:DNA-binding transcriptional MerR regulator
MTVKKVIRKTGLPKKLVKAICSKGLLNLPEGNQDAIERLKQLVYLLMARFSLDQIEAMHKNPETIADTVEEHVRELDGYPALRSLLSQSELKEAQNVFELGAKVGNALPGLIDAELKDGLQKQCLKMSGMLDKAAKKVRAANIVDVFGFIPVVGLPFGTLRTKLLSNTNMREIRELDSALSEMLSRLEPHIDFAAYDQPNFYKGLYYDYSRPALAAGIYINELEREIEYLRERGQGIRKQLGLLAS